MFTAQEEGRLHRMSSAKAPPARFFLLLGRLPGGTGTHLSFCHFSP